MLVKELKKLLENFDEDDMVYVSSDAEGNTVNRLWDIEEFLINEDCEYKLKYLTENLIKQGFSEEDVGDWETDKPAIILFP